jgi:hypothetical protein
VIRSGLLEQYGVGSVSISGYPEGHPDIANDLLWSAIADKSHEVTERGIAGNVISQFSFDVDAVVAWIEQVRSLGITLPIRVGVPRPAGVRRLLTYAGRFGVASSAGIARKYGLSLTNLLGTAGPDRFIRQLSERIDEQHGEVRGSARGCWPTPTPRCPNSGRRRRGTRARRTGPGWCETRARYCASSASCSIPLCRSMSGMPARNPATWSCPPPGRHREPG